MNACISLHAVTSNHMTKLAVTLIRIAKNPVLYANLMFYSSNWSYCRSKFYTAGIKIFFTFFCSCDLDLNPMTFILNMTHIPWRYSGYAKMIFKCQGFLKLSSGRHTYRQTRPKLYTTPLHRWSTMPNGYDYGSRCN